MYDAARRCRSCNELCNALSPSAPLRVLLHSLVPAAPAQDILHSPGLLAWVHRFLSPVGKRWQQPGPGLGHIGLHWRFLNPFHSTVTLNLKHSVQIRANFPLSALVSSLRWFFSSVNNCYRLLCLTHLVEITFGSGCWQESDSQTESNSREVVLFRIWESWGRCKLDKGSFFHFFLCYFSFLSWRKLGMKILL